MSLINIFLVLGTVKTMINDSLQPCGRQFKEATINTWWFPSVGPSYFIQVPKSIYRTHLLIWPLFLTIITVGTMKTSAGRHCPILLSRIITTCHVHRKPDGSGYSFRPNRLSRSVSQWDLQDAGGHGGHRAGGMESSPRSQHSSSSWDLNRPQTSSSGVSSFSSPPPYHVRNQIMEYF